MNIILTGIILCSSFIHGIHGYYYQYPMKVLTSPCHVIDPVIPNEFPSNKIGKNHWANGCPTGTYIKGVWAAIATEHFQKIKCCQGNSDNSLSWELRDLSFFSGGKSGVNEQWNIQCQSNAVITGVRYFKKNNGLRSLSAVRCSSLKYQTTDVNQCMVMNFTDPVVASNLTYKTRWQHECPDGYSLVGLYDDNSFQNIQKGKCCKLIDVPFKPGWTSDFTHNLSNLTQSTEDDGNFKLAPRGGSQTPMLVDLQPSRYKLFRLMTPAFQAGEMCVNISYIKLLSPIKMMVKLVTADSMEILNDDDFARSHVVKKTEELYIRTSTTGQIFIDVQGGNGLIYLNKLEVKDAKACKNANQCSPAKQNCPKNEVCIPSEGVFKCVCDTTRGFSKDTKGKCVNTTANLSTKAPTDGTGKGGGGEGGWATAAKSTIKPTTPNIQKGEKLSAEATSQWTYVAAGASGIVIILIIISGGYVIYQRATAHKRRKRYFDRHLGMSPLNSIAGDSHTQLTQKCSISSVTLETESDYTFCRPYMSHLGSVENAAYSANSTTQFIEACSASSGAHFLESSTEISRPIDPTTGDPLYTKIKREAKSKEQMDENGNLKTTIGRRVAILNEEEDERMFQLNNDHRRPSTMTLLQPDYGDSDDEDMSDESEGERFLVPGDDEEELLCGLNELTPESVRISQKIIGQGAFGLVKLGEFFSTNGTVNVAVKILKRRAGLEITRTDRIKFYQEAAIMSQFDHENVINLFGVLVGNKPCMVIDHMERGNLWKYLNMIRRAREKESVEGISRQLHGLFLKMARDIVSGMTYLASLEFVHRDLAARNILLDSKMRCKISDFGLSRHFLKDDHYYTSKGGQIPVKWTAPEALQYKKYSIQSDVWSYGIVLWEIWSLGKRPYEQWDNNRVLKEVCENGYRLPSPDQTPILIYRIMMDSWKEDKNNRPSFNQIEFCLNHNDDRILGARKKIERTRSITFSIDSEEICSEDDEQIEQQQCRTE